MSTNPVHSMPETGENPQKKQMRMTLYFKVFRAAPTRFSVQKVAKAGLEPARPLRTRDFKSRASANSATWPKLWSYQKKEVRGD